MPSPTRSQVHVDAVLSAMSVAYMQDEAQYFSGKFMPSIPVKKRSDVFYKFDKGDFFRDDAQERAPGTPAAEIGFDVTTGQYIAKRYAAKYKLPWEVRDNADDQVQIEQAAVGIVTQKCLIKRDRVFASNFLTNGVWAADYAGVSGSPGASEFKCWNVTGSTPRKDLRSYAHALQKSVGRRPNRLLLGQQAYDDLVTHGDFSDLIATDKTKLVTPELIAQALDIEEVIVAGSVYNTAAKGQTASMSFIAGDVALLGYVEKNPAIMKPSAGYAFSWSKYDGISAQGAAIKRWSDDDLEADIFVGEIYVAMQRVAADCAIYLSNTHDG
jgi:hypothetical protein